MKMIIAIVQPIWLTNVVAALEAIEGFPGMSISSTRGFGHGRSFEGGYPYGLKMEDYISYPEMLRFEIVARDEMADDIVEVIERTVRTGSRHNGMIYTLPVEGVIRLHTGKVNDGAL
ncbi:MAG TPA: P-II family nitrogen regulator [Blastocatellia bacterium]|nr:P-II family nitrogen regulator [Blastocatellia bacterium]